METEDNEHPDDYFMEIADEKHDDESDDTLTEDDIDEDSALAQLDIPAITQRYQTLDIRGRADLVKSYMRCWEVSDSRYRSVKQKDTIDDDILLGAARGTIVQWAPVCYNSQNRISTAQADKEHACNCIHKYLPADTFQPLDFLGNGFVNAYKTLEREKTLAFRRSFNKMNQTQREREIKLMKKNAKKRGENPPEWSNSQQCETYLAAHGPTAYNHFVKTWNKRTKKDREDHGLPSEVLHPYLDNASKHWKSLIITKGNLKRAMIMLSEESPESTEGEGEDCGVLVCQQAFCSFLSRLPPNKEVSKVYLRLADYCDYLMRLGGRHHFVTRALAYAVFENKVYNFNKAFETSFTMDWIHKVRPLFRKYLSLLELTNDFEAATGDVTGTVSDGPQSANDGTLNTQVSTELRALFGLQAMPATATLSITFAPGIAMPGEGEHGDGERSSVGTTSSHQTAGTRVSKVLGVDGTKKQLQKEYTTSNVDQIVVMHENNKQANDLLAAVNGTVFKSPEAVVTLFHWLERLIPGGGVTTSCQNFKDSDHGIK